MLCPASHSGCAQLTFTECWKLLSTSHWSNHFKWQSQSKLLVFRILQSQEEKKDALLFILFSSPLKAYCTPMHSSLQKVLNLNQTTRTQIQTFSLNSSNTSLSSKTLRKGAKQQSETYFRLKETKGSSPNAAHDSRLEEISTRNIFWHWGNEYGLRISDYYFIKINLIEWGNSAVAICKKTPLFLGYTCWDI